MNPTPVVRRCVPALTMALAAAGFLPSVHAQLQTAGDLLVNVDATSAPLGPLNAIPNTGTLGGVFQALGGASAVPVVAPIYGNGTRAINFDGGDYLQHVASVGGPKVNAPAGLVGANPTCTIEAWVMNPWPDREETIVSWGKRGGPDGSNKSFNYGWDARWGAIGHWGSPDLGWDSSFDTDLYAPGNPPAGVWHHLVLTFDGSNSRVYSDGVLKNSEVVALNTHPNTPITIAAQLEADGVAVTPGLRGSLSIARLRIHDGALSDAAVLNNYNLERGEFVDGAGVPPAYGPIHRYSFNETAGAAASGTVIQDSVAGANGLVLGEGASASGSRLSLPGGSSGSAAYVDLPNGMISKSSRDNGGSGQLTLEGWFRITGVQNWSRIFDFGSSDVADPGLIGGEVTGPGGGGEGLDYLFLSASEGTRTDLQGFSLRNIDGVPGSGIDTRIGFAGPNNDFHFAVTWDEASGVIRAYHNGGEAVVATLPNPSGNDRMSTVNDVNVWLGRSNWTGDANVQGEYDEFRVYDRVLSADELRNSQRTGPDSVSAPQPVTVVKQPESKTVQEVSSTTLSVAAQGVRPYSFQWYKNNNIIPGATTHVLSLNNIPAGDSGSTYFAVIQNTINGTTYSATSQVATLTVIADLQKPTLVSAVAPVGNPTEFNLVFSEPVNESDAENLINYTPQGFTISAAELQADQKTVRITTSSLDGLDCKSIAVSNVRDLAPAQNVIAADSRIGVSYAKGSIRYAQFNAIPGVNVVDLLNNPKFPNSPDVTANKTSLEGPDNDGGDNFNDYGAQMSGFLSPPVSGQYRFWVAADDGAALYLSTDANPANKVQIAREPIWAGFRNYTDQADGGGRACPGPDCNVSEPVTLEAGCKYYIEFIWKEGGGGDFGSVAWQTPANGPSPSPVVDGAAPIPGTFLSPFEIAPTILNASLPANVTTEEGRKVTFTVSLMGTAPLSLQWYRNGEPIEGANGTSYTTDFLDFATDNGATFYVTAQNEFGNVQSRTATLTVTEDSVLPTVEKVQGSTDLTRLVIRFSEGVEALSAVDTFNYGVVGGPNVVEAVLGADGRTVTIKLENGLTPGTAYEVTIGGVTDVAGNAMLGVTLPVTTFVASPGFALTELYMNIGGVAVADLTGNPKYPAFPDIVRYKPTFELNTFDEFENYGARMSGFLLPPVSGKYNFYMSSDDGGAFYLSTDASPANVTLVASEPVWNGRRDWLGTARRNAAAPENRSTTLFPDGIELVAGQMYYFEALVKEGGGGDNLAVTWQLPGAPVPASGSPAIPGIYMAALANPEGAGINITQQPTDVLYAIDPLNPSGGTSLTIAATGTTATNPNEVPVIQWERNDGAGYYPLIGANGTSLALTPTLADNGAKFRARLFVPGATATSAEATLTVIQLNTPPSFTAGPDQNVNEDAGPQTVAWATDILPHSIDRTPIVYNSDFTSAPPGSTIGGNARVDAGILKLTDAVNSQTGSFATPSVATRIDSFTATFKARIGGGTCCGDRTADGWSLSFGELAVPVTFPVAAEEGAGNDLIISFDSWDNAGLDDNAVAPNIDVKSAGTIVAYQALEGVREGGRAPSGPLITDPATGQPMSYKTGDAFANVNVHLDPDGTLDVDFKGVRVVDNVQVGPRQVLNARLVFGARTGGANDNHWIDDLQITAYSVDSSSLESGQTVSFIVSNDNPSLFTVQPSISPDGILTYTTAPNANGSALVTVIAKDSGGTASGGRDTSEPKTFRINVAPVNDCPTANGQTVVADSGTAVNIQLAGTDVDGPTAFTYNVVQAPAHGTVVLANSTGAATYTSAAGYTGPDSFTFTVNDGQCTSAPATVTINVRQVQNHCPVAVAKVEPNVQLSAGQVGSVIIAANNTNACLNLDATGSTDADGDTLSYAWVVVLSDGTTVPLATGATATACLDVGSYTVRLIADDGTCVNTADVAVEIITPSEAVEGLIDMVNNSTMDRRNKRPFIASLKAAGASYDRGSCDSARGQLGAFINKVRAQVAPSDPALAAELIRLANSILAQTECPQPQ